MTNKFTLDNTYIGYLNLDHRTDRRELMEAELKRVGLNAERTRGKMPSEFDRNNPKYKVQFNRTAGSIGCWHGMEEIAMKAYEQGKHAFIMEDDLIFASDTLNRLNIISEFTENNDWDIIFAGGTVHINPPFWHTGINPDLPNMPDLGRDCEYIGHKNIFRTYGSFSTHCWLLNYNSIKKVFSMLDNIEYEAMGIDWALIKLAPQLKSFCFLPGFAIQRDNQSDIGNGWTYFSGFARLGAHWFADKLNDFDPLTYNWGEVGFLKENHI